MQQGPFKAAVVFTCFLILIFCIMTTARSDDSAFGVCVDVAECKDEAIPRLISECKIKWTRQIFRWDLIEPAKGEFHWEDFDKAVTNQLKYGLKVYGQLQWMSWSDPTKGDDEAIRNWSNFVSLTVKRYKDKIKYWEAWNEEDFIGFWKPYSVENYIKLLKATYITAKGIDPDCKIILGGLMGWGAQYTYFPFIDELYQKGGGEWFDIMAIHPYTMPHAPGKDTMLRRKIDDAIERMRRNGDSKRRIWITELGWPSDKLTNPGAQRAVTESQQAEYLKEALKICLSYSRVEKVFWYSFRDTAVDRFNSEHHYGLVNYYLGAKPSFAAYKKFILDWENQKQ